MKRITIFTVTIFLGSSLIVAPAHGSGSEPFEVRLVVVDFGENVDGKNPDAVIDSGKHFALVLDQPAKQSQIALSRFGGEEWITRNLLMRIDQEIEKGVLDFELRVLGSDESASSLIEKNTNFGSAHPIYRALGTAVNCLTTRGYSVRVRAIIGWEGGKNFAKSVDDWHKYVGSAVFVQSYSTVSDTNNAIAQIGQEYCMIVVLQDHDSSSPINGGAPATQTLCVPENALSVKGSFSRIAVKLGRLTGEVASEPIRNVHFQSARVPSPAKAEEFKRLKFEVFEPVREGSSFAWSNAPKGVFMIGDLLNSFTSSRFPVVARELADSLCGLINDYYLAVSQNRDLEKIVYHGQEFMRELSQKIAEHECSRCVDPEGILHTFILWADKSTAYCLCDTDSSCKSTAEKLCNEQEHALRVICPRLTVPQRCGTGK